MDDTAFDRIIKQLASPARRRETLLALAGAGIMGTGALDADDAASKKKRKRKKKKERKLGQTCGGKKKCSQKQGPATCVPFGSNFECFGVELTGNRCCGQEGAKCDPSFGGPGAFGNCSCCGNLFCGEQTDGSFRCQTEDT